MAGSDEATAGRRTGPGGSCAWRGRASRVSGTLLAVAAVAAGSTSAARIPDRLAGPFGHGAAEVWLVLPTRPMRAIVVFGHGWKLFPPSAKHPWVGQFRP